MRSKSRPPGNEARDTAMDMEVGTRWRCVDCGAIVVFDSPVTHPAECPACQRRNPAFTVAADR